MLDYILTPLRWAGHTVRVGSTSLDHYLKGSVRLDCPSPCARCGREDEPPVLDGERPKPIQRGQPEQDRRSRAGDDGGQNIFQHLAVHNDAPDRKSRSSSCVEPSANVVSSFGFWTTDGEVLGDELVGERSRKRQRPRRSSVHHRSGRHAAAKIDFDEDHPIV